MTAALQWLAPLQLQWWVLNQPRDVNMHVCAASTLAPVSRETEIMIMCMSSQNNRVCVWSWHVSWHCSRGWVCARTCALATFDVTGARKATMVQGLAASATGTDRSHSCSTLELERHVQRNACLGLGAVLNTQCCWRNAWTRAGRSTHRQPLGRSLGKTFHPCAWCRKHGRKASSRPTDSLVASCWAPGPRRSAGQVVAS